MNLLELSKKTLNASTSVSIIQRETILKFIKESAQNHLSHGRDSQIKFKNMLAKLAEYGGFNICENLNINSSEVDLTNCRYGDGGWDLKIEGYNVDVKQYEELNSSYGKKNERIYLGQNNKKKVYWVIEFHEDSSTYISRGFIPHTFENIYFDYSNKSYYCNIKDLSSLQTKLNKYDDYESKSPIKSLEGIF